VVVVQFSKGFEKDLKKYCSKTIAKKVVKKLIKTQLTDGKQVARITNVLIKECRMNTFRFYFIQDNTRIQYLSKNELANHILQFVAISKKNNQQEVIDKLKTDLQSFGFKLT